MSMLTLKRAGWYLNFSAWCTKTVGVIWTEKHKIIKQTAFCGKCKRNYAACLRNAL